MVCCACGCVSCFHFTFPYNPTNEILIKTGMVTSFAGQHESGMYDGVGTNARFRGPKSMALDKNNNMYVADGAAGVRILTLEGAVTTLRLSISLNCVWDLSIDEDDRDRLIVADNKSLHFIQLGGQIIDSHSILSVNICFL